MTPAENKQTVEAAINAGEAAEDLMGVRLEYWEPARAALRAVVAQADRAAELEAALRPFAQDAEAFDLHHPYGDGPIFERLSADYHWKFTVADVMRARDVLAGDGGGA